MATSHYALHQTSMPTKGVGLFAAEPIPPGSLIISERPILILKPHWHNIASDLAAKLNSLSPSDKASFYALSNQFSTTTTDKISKASGIAKTNLMPVNDQLDAGGVYPTCARINHSCNPNCGYYYSPATGVGTIRSLKGIEKGKEITISYLNAEQLTFPSVERQKYILKNFAFNCQCELCSATEHQKEEYDERRENIANLQRILIDAVSTGEPGSNAELVLQTSRNIIKLWKEEGVEDSRLSEAYLLSAQACAYHGDVARGTALVRECVRISWLREGSDGETFGREVALMDDVGIMKGRFHFGPKWETEREEMVSRESEGFEEWLWMRADDGVEAGRKA